MMYIELMISVKLAFIAICCSISFRSR